MKQKPKKNEQVEPLSLLGKANEAARVAIEGLSRCVSTVSAELGEDTAYSDRKASHLAYLTEAVVRVMGELRQQEKHDRDAAKNMTPDERLSLVRSFVAELPPEQLALIRADLDELDAAGSVL